MSLVLAGLAVVAALVATLRPLWRSEPQAALANPTAGERVSLETSKARLYESIRDLDFDHATGKLNEDDYRELRASLLRQAADVVRQLDVLEGADALDEAIEAMLATRLAVGLKIGPSCPACGVPAREAARFCSHCGHAIESPKCAGCGQTLLPGDSFCEQCGHKIVAS